jgi:hypothetical protein
MTPLSTGRDWPGQRLLCINRKRSPGNDLLSHTVASAVPSALESLTSRFGMDLGVSSPLASPEESIFGVDYESAY